MSAQSLSAEEIVRLLDMQPHPEGGWFRETYRDAAPEGERAASTAIYYLLKGGETSAWHRVDATEAWHWYAGGPLTLRLSPDGETTEAHELGADLAAGERPQCVIPPGWWQTATSRGLWTLVGCTVAPAFEFAGFEMAPPGWRPGG
jgi:predicted cupin superfamily sugar epimerase